MHPINLFKKMNKKVILIILDGWGLGTNPEVSAIHKAKTPFMDSLIQKYPHSKLEASGLAVGLPEGQMGNSEVGHMNIGAGRVVYQDLVRINKAIEEKSLSQHPELLKAIEYAKNQHKKIHLLGLLSDGGVHSHIEHLKGLCNIFFEHHLKEVYVHAFLDGRDTDPYGGKKYLQDLQEHLNRSTGRIASVIGRYYAMDRDKRWDRVKQAYDLLVKGIGKETHHPVEAVQQSYDQGITDEFVKPIVHLKSDMHPVATIDPGDVVLFFNFRNDRARQLTTVLSQQDLHEHGMHKMDLYYLTMTPYDDTFENVHILFDKEDLSNTIGEVIAKAGKKQLRIAETEKYPHVTFFFSGGQEDPFSGEDRILCPSPKVATYDLQPEMSAVDIRDAVVKELDKQELDFICLNFANPDMVGHTGDFKAAIKACETVDNCTETVVNAALKNGYSCLIIADHGNADIMVKEDGTPHTAHTTNLVPCILVDGQDGHYHLKDGKLGDIAPTILQLMGLEVPATMSGENLVVNS